MNSGYGHSTESCYCANREWFSPLQPGSHCTVDYKEPCFPSAGGNIDDWRRGETNHRAADFAAKQKWVRIHEHWLQFPLGLAEDRKHFRVQIERILHNVVG